MFVLIKLSYTYVWFCGTMGDGIEKCMVIFSGLNCIVSLSVSVSSLCSLSTDWIPTNFFLQEFKILAGSSKSVCGYSIETTILLDLYFVSVFRLLVSDRANLKIRYLDYIEFGGLISFEDSHPL